jgi:hypothetical protein
LSLFDVAPRGFAACADCRGNLEHALFCGLRVQPFRPTGQRYRVTRVSVQIQRALTTKTKPASDSALSMSMFYKIVLALIVIAKSVEMADARKLRYQQKAERV